MPIVAAPSVLETSYIPGGSNVVPVINEKELHQSLLVDPHPHPETPSWDEGMVWASWKELLLEKRPTELLVKRGLFNMPWIRGSERGTPNSEFKCSSAVDDRTQGECTFRSLPGIWQPAFCLGLVNQGLCKSLDSVARGFTDHWVPAMFSWFPRPPSTQTVGPHRPLQGSSS